MATNQGSCQKNGYPTKKAAIKFARRMRLKKDSRAYYCHECGEYHLTTQDKDYSRQPKNKKYKRGSPKVNKWC